MPINRVLGLLTALSTGLGLPASAEGNDPLSAIDWLSQSVTSPTPASASVASSAAADPQPDPDEPPVSEGGALPTVVATTPLDGPSPDAIGLIPPAVSGFPRDLWGAGLTLEIATAISRDRMDSLPALRQLFLTMLLAEAAPPIDSEGKGRLLQARIDKLLFLGALEQAAALIDIAGPATTPELFRRAFDIALLTGDEHAACDEMQANPSLAPTPQARIFCLARAGDWDVAALTLRTSEALGQVDADRAALMSRFLDPDLFEGEEIPPPPVPVTPLDLKMFEGIGEPLSTETLPVAFAYAETGPNIGWKARIDATERLTRAGTIAPNGLLGVYTESEAAASGGVWDRVDAFQAFEAAYAARDADRMGKTLPVIWAMMQEAELEVPFAFLFGKGLAGMPLSGAASDTAFRIGLLSPEYEAIALARQPRDLTETFLIGVATGNLKGVVPPDSMARAIAPAFLSPSPSPGARALLDGNRLGEAILSAIDSIADGVQGDLQAVTEGLSLLREVRLETVARRTALELLILERRG
jgi:hypothetical protein